MTERRSASDGFQPFAGSVPPSTADRLAGTQPAMLKEVAMKTESNTEVHRWRGFAVLAVAYFMTRSRMTN